MRYVCDGAVRTEFQTTDALRYRRYLIEEAELSFLSLPAGDVLSQAITFFQYRIIINHYFNKKDLSVNVLFDNATVMLHFVTQGSIQAYSVHGRHEAAAGAWNLLYIPPHASYSLYLSMGHSSSVQIILDLAFLEKLSVDLPQLGEIIFNLKNNDPDIVQLFPAVIDFRVKTLLEEIINFMGGTGKALYVHSRVCELLWHYAQQMSRSKQIEVSGAYISKLEDVKNFIISNLNLPLGTSYLARRFQISVTSLKRQFKLYYGKNIRDFITEQRMERAMEIVLHSEQSISSIGSQLGYSEFSSFTRAFTRYFGHSPNHFRK